MRYVLLIDPEAQDPLDKLYGLPVPVRDGLIERLNALEEDAHTGVTEIPVFGLCCPYEQAYAGIIWKILVFIHRDDEAGVVYVKDWIVIDNRPQ